MPELSIIIPAYNEQHKIQKDIYAADKYLSDNKIEGEIIVVDDGSSDDTSEAARKTAQDVYSECRVITLEHNTGKGCAVRSGIIDSKGDYAAFADCGCCVPYEEINIGLDLIRNGNCQIAHGSRKLSGCHINRPQTIYRKICSQIFHWFLIHDIKKLAKLTDTQCGFKVYRGDVAREIYGQSKIDSFMFDIETILIALVNGYSICEFPINWTCDPDSRLKPSHEIYKIIKDLIWLKKTFNPYLKQQKL